MIDRWRLFCWGLAAMVLLTASQSQSIAEDGKSMLVYIGTYTRGDRDGIYVYSINAETGKLTKVGSFGGIINPSFLAIHPNKQFLYAVSEVSEWEGKPTGGVAAYAIDSQTGLLRLLNQQPSEGTSPCHLIVEKTGKSVLVANYSSGTVTVLPVQADGSLAAPSCTIQHEGTGPNTRRQEGPHAHSINVDPSNTFAFAADLGIDKLLIYRLSDDKKTLETNPAQPFAEVKPGAGPRHFTFHPNGTVAYVINELDSTITVFDYDKEKGTLTATQSVSTLPEDFSGSTTTAEVQVHPSGRFVYGSNRGHDSIAIFTADPKTGKLTAAGHVSTKGKTPRNFAINPAGTLLLAANQDTDNIVVFRIDGQTGQLTPTGEEIHVPNPVCVKLMTR